MVANIPNNIAIPTKQIENERNYWQKKLSGELIRTYFPYDNMAHDLPMRKMADIRFEISSDLFSKLIQLSRGSDNNIYIILSTCLIVLLNKFTGNKDIIITSPIYKQEIAGEFINTILAIRLQLTGKESLKELIVLCKNTVFEANEYLNFPIERLTKELTFQSIENGYFFAETGILLENIHYKKYIEHLNLNVILSFLRTNEHIKGLIEYNHYLYKSDTIIRIKEYFIKLLELILNNLNLQIVDIEILSEEERHRILKIFNETKADFPKNKTIHNLFEDQVEISGEHIAVVKDGYTDKLSYKKLNERANQLGRILTKKGILTGTIVAVSVLPSIEIVIAILAILKAGGTYLPIDSDLPEGRINYMLKDSNANLLLTTHHSKEQCIYEIEFINIYDDTIYTGDSSNIKEKSKPDDIIYVIYTSGTSGKPKGVMIKNQNLVNYSSWFVKKTALNNEDKSLLVSSFAFDLGYTSVFPTILSGGELHILTKEIFLSPEKLLDYIKKNRITYIKLTPSLFFLIVNHSDFSKEKCKTLRFIVMGGEPIHIHDLEKAHELCENLRIMNHYGPTETTVGSIAQFIDWNDWEEYKRKTTIGRPIDNTEIYILDEIFKPVPLGVPGELCISGAGVSFGYLNQPHLTAEKFIVNLPLEKATSRIYKTGDLARWTANGYIEFLGRIDSQVKIRGFRIEVEEIEEQILKHKHIKNCAVIAREAEDGGKYLCAYYVSSEPIETSSIKEFLASKLPYYMVPSYFTALEKIPLTSNGKLDHRALPKPGVINDINYIPPQNELQQIILAIWSKVLGIEEKLISIDGNFFELGGDSLKATILIGKIHKECNAQVTLLDLFKFPTVRRLCENIDAFTKVKFLSIEPDEEKEYYRLSSAQKRLFLLQQIANDSTFYNVPLILSIEGYIDLNFLNNAFKILIARHDSLRTSFDLINEEPVQRIFKKVNFDIQFFDALLERMDIETTIKNIMRPFDLKYAPLMRATIIKIEDRKYIFYLDMHHIIRDGQSGKILISELMALYAERELPPLLLQYKDYSEWQQKLEIQNIFTEQREYWLKEFEDEIPVSNLPTDYPRPPIQSFEGNRMNFKVNEEDTKKLNAIAKLEGATIFILLMAIYNIFLSKISSQDDIVIGVPIAGRKHPDLEKIVGMFVNTLAMRNYPYGAKTFKKFLSETREKTIKSFENQDSPFENIVEKLILKRDISRNPLFDVVLVVQNISDSELLDVITEEKIKDLIIKPYDYENKTSKFDLILAAMEKNGEIYLSLQYCTKLFKKATIERFIIYFKKILIDVIENKERKIADFEIVTEEEKKQILYDFNNTEAEYPKDKTIQQLFEEQVKKSPDRIAVVAPVQSVNFTYRQLNEQSHLLAGLLIEKGVQTDTIVGIMMERSVEMIVGILGILKSGGAYLPIDPMYPQERIDHMMKDSNTEVLLINKSEIQNPKLETNPNKTNSNAPNKNQNSGAALVLNFENLNLNSIKGCPRRGISEFVFRASNLSSSNLAYVIYTSGSTGRPKGVMVNHHSVVNYIKWAIKNYIKNQENVSIPLFTPLSFDLTVTSIFTPLLSGNSILAYKETFIDKIIEDNRVQVMKLTPSHLKIILEISPKLRYNIKRFIVGGESLETKLAENITGKFNKSLEIYNEYGPTEATIGCMIYRFSNDYAMLPAVPIGKPADNVQIYILDKNRKPVPVGVPGEIYIGGECVARGYLNCPELTAEKFGPLIMQMSQMKNKSFFGEAKGAAFSKKNPLVYKTGDLAKFLDKGNIEFLGRIDQQVKIRGFRIELGEIQEKIMGYKRHKPLTIDSLKTLINRQMSIPRCGKCLLPANYPGIHFDQNGVCNICLEYETYKDKAEKYFKSSTDFYPLIENIKKEKRNEYDCLLLFSGGKDSTYVLYKLIDMGLKVLTFTFDNGYISNAAFANIKNITSGLGIENIVCRAKNMKKIFVESLHTNHNACHGCWNVLNTMGIKIAHEKNINLVISGLSRGQIVEMRLEGLFKLGIFDEHEIEKNLLLFRKSFHSKTNIFSQILDVELPEDAVENIHFVDFFRYFDTPVSEISTYLTKQGWRRPENTGFCSSNCIINDVGIYVHLKERHYHFYAAPLSWDCRLGVISREQGIRETGFEDIIDFKDEILKEIGYYNSPIKDAIVIDNEGYNNDKYLCAYIVTDEDLSIEDLKKYLSDSLPGYMIPSYFVPINKIPLTPNGKIDRKALPAPEAKVYDEYIPPVNEIEKSLALIWSDVLGRKEELIGINDNFFQLGGHSLKIIRLISKIQDELGVKISIAEVFKRNTIRALSEYINISRGRKNLDIKPLEKKEYYDVSFGQMRVWASSQSNESSLSFNICSSYILKEELNRVALIGTFNCIIGRHESLRTIFIVIDEDLKQKVLTPDELNFRIDYKDIGEEKDKNKLVRDLFDSEKETPFNLLKGPLIRTKLIKIDTKEYLILFSMHHIISDFLSLELLKKEFIEVYASLTKGIEKPLKPLRIQYKDFASWQNKQLIGANLEQLKQYWRNQFNDKIQLLKLPYDKKRPKIQSYNGEKIDFVISKTVTDGLRTMAAKSNMTLFMVLFTSVNALLHYYTGQNDIIVGIPVSGREHPDIAEQIGFYLNTLVLRVRFGCDTFDKLLKIVEKVIIQAFEHQLYPFDKLVEDLGIKKNPDRHPLFDVMVDMMNLTKQIHPGDILSNESVNNKNDEPFHFSQCKCKFDLTIFFIEKIDSISANFTYNIDLFERKTITWMVKRYKNLLERIIQNPFINLSELQLEDEIKVPSFASFVSRNSNSD